MAREGRCGVVARAGGLLLALVVAAACGSAPTRQPGPSTSPSTSVAPADTPAGPRPGASLAVSATVRAWCGSVGGCAYVAQLDGPAGRSEGWFDIGPAAHGSGDRALRLGPGLPSSLPPGNYALRLSAMAVSDVIGPGGTREHGPVLATCTGFFTVEATTVSVTADGTFLAAACTIALGRR